MSNFSDLKQQPKDYPVECRRKDRRVLIVDSTRTAVRVLSAIIVVLFVTIMTVGGALYYSVNNVNNELMGEEISGPPIDVSVDQPDEPIELEVPDGVSIRRRK